MVLQVSFSDFFSGISSWIVEPFVTVTKVVVATIRSITMNVCFFLGIAGIIIPWPWVDGARVVSDHGVITTRNKTHSCNTLG